jgi:hypothetical protein
MIAEQGLGPARRVLYECGMGSKLWIGMRIGMRIEMGIGMRIWMRIGMRIGT